MNTSIFGVGYVNYVDSRYDVVGVPCTDGGCRVRSSIQATSRFPVFRVRRPRELQTRLMFIETGGIHNQIPRHLHVSAHMTHHPRRRAPVPVRVSFSWTPTGFHLFPATSRHQRTKKNAGNVLQREIVPNVLRGRDEVCGRVDGASEIQDTCMAQ